MSTAFTLPADRLADTAAWLEKLIPARPPMPVLGGALLTAGDDTLTAAAFDYDLSGSVTVPCEVDIPGTVLVSGRLLAAIAKAAPKTATVTVVCDDRAATLTAGRSEWVLPLLPVEDYPALPELGEPVGEIDAAVLAEAATRVLPAAGRGDTVPMLTGVKLESDADQLTLAATDRFRLAVATVGWKPSGDGPLDLLVPAVTVAQMVRGVSGTVALHADTSGNAAAFGATTEHRRVTGRLLDAQFPRWRQLINPDPGHWCTVDTAALREALDQAAVYGPRAAYRMQVSADRVELSAADDDRTAHADTAVQQLSGDPVTVGVNPVYLGDALSGLGETARIFLPVSSTRPLLFRTDGDETHQHLLMPVRLPEVAAA